MERDLHGTSVPIDKQRFARLSSNSRPVIPPDYREAMPITTTRQIIGARLRRANTVAAAELPQAPADPSTIG